MHYIPQRLAFSENKNTQHIRYYRIESFLIYSLSSKNFASKYELEFPTLIILLKLLLILL